MAQNETDSGLFVALNYFSHLPHVSAKKKDAVLKVSTISKKLLIFFALWQELTTTTVDCSITASVEDKVKTDLFKCVKS